MNSVNKDTLNFIKKYKKICETDPKFEDMFMIFFEEKIIDYQNKVISAEDLDQEVNNFIDVYLSLSRDGKLKSILGKK